MSRGLRMSQEQLDGITRKLTGIVKAAPRAVNSSLAPKPTKYRNKPTTDADGIRHASKKQAARYRDLGLLMKSGEIMMLAREVRFRLPGGIEYRCDHLTANQRAIEVMAALVESGDLICEDVKSEATRKDRTYINKAKQMKECLGFPVREV